VRRLVPLLLLISILCPAANPPKASQDTSLDAYLKRLRAAPSATADLRSPGSLWVDSGWLSDSASDQRARSVGDIITINISELTTAETSASVDTQRKFSANSGISALAGKINTSGVESLFSPNSAQTLQGKGQATADSKLQTTLSGRVVATLPSGALVIEAQREVLIHNQRNRVLVRGVARPVDITAENSIASSRLSNLEVALNGKGVVSDGTRQPNILVRLLLRLVNF